MKLSGRTPRPWVKLWKEERGSFAQLPFLTRAVASELLKFLDDDGRIFVGTKHPADAIAFVAGATRGDRRVMRVAIDDLVTNGYLRVVDGWAEAAGYAVWQYGEAATKSDEPTATAHDGATTAHEAATTEQRPCNEDAAKCAESLSPPRQEGEGEGEKRGKGADAPKALSLALSEPPTKTPAQVVFDRWIEVTSRTSRTEFSDARRKRVEWALKTYGLDDTLAALDGLARSDWHMGRDPKSNGEKYDDLTLVFRDATKFEKFRDQPAQRGLSLATAAVSREDAPDWHPTHGAPKSARNFDTWEAWINDGCPRDPAWKVAS